MHKKFKKKKKETIKFDSIYLEYFARKKKHLAPIYCPRLSVSVCAVCSTKCE